MSDHHSLDEIALLAEVPEADRRALVQQCAWRRYRRGGQIIDRDGESSDIYFVIAGAVRVVFYSASGREVTLGDRGPGSHFGELAAIDGAPRSASVVALEDSVLACLSSRRFNELLEDHPRVALALLRDLTGIVRDSTERIVGLSTLSSQGRVVAEILRLAEAAEMQGEGAFIRPLPVHGVLASRLGTTRETVARAMSLLSRRGVVRRDRDALVVLDVEALARILEDSAG